jgi:hypothetical protein
MEKEEVIQEKELRKQKVIEAQKDLIHYPKT